MTNNDFEEVVESKHNILNNRPAGGGKSTFCRNLLHRLDLDKCHYITFSKVMADEFKQQLGNSKCKVSTIHSLAFNNLRLLGWNPAKLPFQDFPLTYTAFNKMFGLKIGDNSYNTIKFHWDLWLNTEEKSRIYSNKITNLDGSENPVLKRMFMDIVEQVNKQVLPCSHNYYLKKYALQFTPLNTDLLIQDEVQDCSPLTYTILKNQECRIIGVGDTYQNIYSELMKTVNLFDLVDWKTYYSTDSFRVTEETANLSNKILSVLNAPFEMVGLNPINSPKGTTDAVLFTSNYEMLKTVYKGKEKVNIIINQQKLNEVLDFVENVQLFLIGKFGTDWKLNNFLKQKKSVHDLILHYAKIDEKNKAGIVIDVKVSKYLFFKDTVISKMTKSSNTSKDVKTYCTIHQSKGLTFNNVFLTWNNEIPNWFEDPKKYKTELNLLYVAVTRASVKFESDEIFFDYLK